jgi:glycosyltransferase involved in cell wall biosynthesis
MLISVVIPAYNRSHCIGRALESVRVQGIADLEVLVGDDASTDSTVAEVERLMPEARIVRLPVNRGAAGARNAVLPLVRGEFVACLDSDDEWLPGKLKRQLEFLDARPDVGVVGSGHILACKDGRRVEFPGKNPPDWRRELHSAESFHGACTPLIRREVLERVGPLDERLRVLEDWDWMLRFSQETSIHVLQESLTVIHENNPSDPDHTIESTRLFLEKHYGEFLRYGKAHARASVSQHYENAARNLFRHDRSAAGCRYLWKALLSSPMRNPAMIAAFPLAAWDAVAGTQVLPAILGHRNRLPLRKSA